MKRFLIIIIIFLSCRISFAQDHSIKIAPFHFLYTPIPKVDYEFAFKTNRSIGLTIDYYNFSASDNGITFKPYYRYYFEGKNTMPSRGFYIMPSLYLGQTNQQYYYGSCSWSGSCFDTIISSFVYGAGVELGWQDNVGPNKRILLDFSIGLKFIPFPSNVPESYTSEYGKVWERTDGSSFNLDLGLPNLSDWNESYVGFPIACSFFVGYKIFKSD